MHSSLMIREYLMNIRAVGLSVDCCCGMKYGNSDKCRVFYVVRVPFVTINTTARQKLKANSVSTDNFFQRSWCSTHAMRSES